MWAAPALVASSNPYYLVVPDEILIGPDEALTWCAVEVFGRSFDDRFISPTSAYEYRGPDGRWEREDIEVVDAARRSRARAGRGRASRAIGSAE